MDAKLTPFLFEADTLVRVSYQDGAPWFIGEDACTALGIAKHRDAMARLDQGDTRPVEVDGSAGVRTVTALSEGGLYTLVLRCRGAMTEGTVAYRFRRWITHEVLPAIRRTGSYHVIPPEPTGEPPLRSKPYDEWTMEETRTQLAVSNCYRHTLNNAAAAWYLMRAGFPRSPALLMPAWWQAELLLGTPADSRAMVVVSVPNGNGTH
jgi:prophage antirepressor-like protein